MRAAPLVLVAEHDDDMRDLLVFAVETAAFRAAQASTAADVTRLASEMRPAVLLLGLSLPGVDDVEGLRRLRDGLPQEVPIAVMTGNAYPTVLRRIKAAGAAAILVKPFTDEHVSNVLRALVDARAPRRDSPPPARDDDAATHTG